MNKSSPAASAEEVARFTLTSHRSLSPKGFLILMGGVSAVSFVTGYVFYQMGAWPVSGFFGLDVLLIYIAFKLNYRSGRAKELIEVRPDLLRITRIEPDGKSTVTDLNPYWTRVGLDEKPDGRATLSLTSHGQQIVIGRLLNNDERREFSSVLSNALQQARSRTVEA
jgi:uncharacterized membrane protein